MEKENMLGVALAEMAGPMKDFSDKLGGPDGTRWWEEFKRYLRKEPTWVHRLLDLVTTVEVGGAKKFVVADNFKVGNAGIIWLGDNFKSNFLGKVETNVQPAILRVHRLTEAALDEPIRAELGSDCEETFLAHLLSLLKKQDNGQAGPLLTKGYATVFYIRDAKGDLWAVDAYRFGAGWYVIASSVSGPYRWRAGGQVVSR